MRRVILETPFAGDVARNLRYARACARDCLLRGEAPFASHLIYTQPGVLDDDKLWDRHLGMTAGLAWGAAADATVVYGDLGVSRGMEVGIAAARAEGRPVEERVLGGNWEAQPIYPTRWEQPRCRGCGHRCAIDGSGYCANNPAPEEPQP